MTNSGRVEVWLGVGVIAFALGGYLLVIPAGVDSPSSVPFLALAPAFWPNIIMGLLCVLGVVMIIQGLRSKAQAVPDDGVEETFDSARLLRTGAAMAVLFVYYLALQKLGFVVASMLALLFYLPLAGVRQIFLIGVISVFLPIALYYFFTIVAKVALPLGVFETLLS